MNESGQKEAMDKVGSRGTGGESGDLSFIS